MSKGIFGTDGMRGTVGKAPMLAETALRLGLAAGHYFHDGKKRHKVLIGKDTRISGYIFETALTSGFCAAGMDVYLVGPLPTPAISFLARDMLCTLGVVISASHNPFMDNGIKFFDKNGFKLPDEVEDEISNLVLNPETSWQYPLPEAVGKARRVKDTFGRYIVHLKHSFGTGYNLDGLKVVLDCAHGATYKVAPMVLTELGATVVTIGAKPDGLNINAGYGSLYPQNLADRVLAEGADIGLALDGDGDRLIVVDEKGKILDGDQIMALCALDKLSQGTLTNKTVVGTVMSNMALEILMAAHGIKFVRTAVGDRYVVEAMQREGAVLGGEQSGHLIFADHSTTGDGILAGLQLLRIMVEKQAPVSQLAHLLEPWPQVLINVEVTQKIPFENIPAIARAHKDISQKLAQKGRILLRYSGTENKARVMVEGKDQNMVQELAKHMAEVIKAHI